MKYPREDKVLEFLKLSDKYTRDTRRKEKQSHYALSFHDSEYKL